MPPTDQPNEAPEHLTITQIATRLDRSRQLIHRLATTDPAFPPPVITPGTTRPKYLWSAIEAWWAKREVRQGRRTDLDR